MLHTENGILFQTYPIESGTSKNGTPWANQRIIIEQQNGNAVNRLALKVPQKNLDEVGSITPGSAVSFSYIIDCHAYNNLFAGKQLRTPSPRAEFDENGDSADLPF
jgi:CRISPR/Cas system CSM-associated protein Csm3 (group 7 of RAMP superfamily)